VASIFKKKKQTTTNHRSTFQCSNSHFHQHYKDA